uniref:Uncharacterized protein n=1 Tax=Salmonella phage vB_SE130_2P TaxID=3236707 RepID=A0AB39C403_9VIRU
MKRLTLPNATLLSAFARLLPPERLRKDFSFVLSSATITVKGQSSLP